MLLYITIITDAVVDADGAAALRALVSGFFCPEKRRYSDFLELSQVLNQAGVVGSAVAPVDCLQSRAWECLALVAELYLVVQETSAALLEKAAALVAGTAAGTVMEDTALSWNTA